MKRSLSISIVLNLLLTTTNWVSASYETSTATQAVEAPTDCEHVGRIIEIQGYVRLKRKEWRDYHRTFVGTKLCLGDLLQPVSKAKVIVQCTDPEQNLWTVPNGMPSGAANGCPPPYELIYRPTGPIPPTRDPIARRIPYIISPKNTWLLSDKPKLRWIAVPDATSYVVRISGSGVNWETEVSTTEVVYPGEPSLKPGEGGYLLTVEADNGESSDKATFGLLDANQATIVRDATERIAKENLTDDAKTLAQAELYIGQGLIAEATEILSASTVKDSQTAAIYYILGDLYAQVQLLPQAEASYIKAMKLATIVNDQEGQTVVATRLAQLYEALGNSRPAGKD
ncbi:lipopolysaccharide assembly protein LapB [Nostoc sp. CHAB 5715]|uniref:tetratricopeptide repeat protein n=1 Tax=Nostoc sp. CHAB 5715 TaxID=2780400 RepID=UPI001E5D0054|nr:tetratricopeptide repeat protein [Nostoc sp. CHAB 5715]MCC5624280.1 tetratricopeptide repeat protein [Nostoc sp. CHAB 5715]